MTRVTTATARGRNRTTNQDAYLVRTRRKLQVLAVADGMGGGVRGDVASRTALEVFATELFTRVEAVSLEDAAAAATRRAASALETAGAGAPGGAPMATTLTAVCLRGGTGVLAHAGDSRAYLWRGGSLITLTQDHSVTGELVRAGAIPQAQAAHHEHRHVLTQALGVPGLQPQVESMAFHAGDVLLLCTDGVHTSVPPQMLERLLADAPGAAAARAVRAAAAAGGTDDATAIAAEFTSGGSRTAGGIALLALGALLAGGTATAGSSRFLGISDGRVTLFRGLPYEVAGVPLHRLERVFATTARDLPAVYRDRLSAGVWVRDEEEALRVLQQMPRRLP